MIEGLPVTTIGLRSFEGISVISITIPDSVASIGDAAFEACTGLTSVNLPDSLTAIGQSTFRDCASLTSVAIGNGVSSIAGAAFAGCTILTAVYFPGSAIDGDLLLFQDALDPMNFRLNRRLPGLLLTAVTIALGQPTIQFATNRYSVAENAGKGKGTDNFGKRSV